MSLSVLICGRKLLLQTIFPTLCIALFQGSFFGRLVCNTMSVLEGSVISSASHLPLPRHRHLALSLRDWLWS